MAVDTKRVAGRRQVHFASYRDLLDDLRSLAARPTRQLGNWSLGKICEHLAVVLGMAIDGPSFRPPWLVRTIGPLLKRRILTRGMPAGFRLPKYAGQLIPHNDDAIAGIAAVEKAIARLETTAERQPHPVLGVLTREEWDQLQLRHAEMHLSFIVPQ